LGELKEKGVNAEARISTVPKKQKIFIYYYFKISIMANGGSGKKGILFTPRQLKVILDEGIKKYGGRASFAEAIDYHRASLSKFANGKVGASIETGERIYAALGAHENPAILFILK